MNRPQRNHNPGNLRFAHQREAIRADKDGFAVYDNDPAGWRALVSQIRLDQARGDTIEKFVSEFAPTNENDTETYINVVARGLRAKRSDPLSDFSPYAVAGLIAMHEGYMVREA